MILQFSLSSFAAHWPIDAGVLMPASSIRRSLLHRGLRDKVLLYRIPLTANHRLLRLQWVHEHRAWQADWHQVVFSDESRFSLWNHNGRVRVRHYAGQHCFPEFVIEWHSGQKHGVIVWFAISYHGRLNFLRFEDNLHSNRNVRKTLLPEIVPFLQSIPRTIFQQDNACSDVIKTVRDFCSSQHKQHIPWLSYWPDMSPIEHVWDLVSRRDPRPGASKNAALAAHSSNMEISFTSRQSKSVWLYSISYSNIYCSSWWLYQILLLDTYIFFFENFVIYLYQYKSFVH